MNKLQFQIYEVCDTTLRYTASVFLFDQVFGGGRAF